ncbi:MAG: glycosyltransferase [Candidatus Electrothrix sp. AX5]|jgi:glycosyltransferase involved in cell wall biosynthesis|nr:glycosyltransferase [Candidatus Electrothrix sp. AX5]
MNNVEVIITGTDPESRKGGIGHALPGYLAALRKIGIEPVVIPTYHPVKKGGKFFLWLTALPKIIRAINDIRSEGKVCVVYSHAGAGVSLFREFVITIVSRCAGAKTIQQIHSAEAAFYLENSLKRILFKLSMIGVNRTLVLTPWWKSTFSSNGIKNIDIMPNPLPVHLEEKAKSTFIKKTEDDSSILNVLVLTRLVEGKGVDLAIESMKCYSGSIKLVIAGEGPLLVRLMHKVREFGLEKKVFFRGWLHGQLKQDALDQASILCHQTTFDSMPMNILEAMANGIPVIALNHGSIPDLVKHNKTGYLLDDPSPKELANAIKSLLSYKKRIKMGLEAKKYVLENYSIEKAASNIKNILEKVIEH